jgi:hypothetical protein
MGRAGIEPATLGLKAAARGLVGSRAIWVNPLLMPDSGLPEDLVSRGDSAPHVPTLFPPWVGVCRRKIGARSVAPEAARKLSSCECGPTSTGSTCTTAARGSPLRPSARRVLGAGSGSTSERSFGDIVAKRWAGRRAVVEHVTYCTARVIGDPRAVARQSAYLRALELSGSVDLIEYGQFKETYKRYPRATAGTKGRPILVGAGRPQMVGIAHREEKGSDVNLASRLLIDALTFQMDAAVVVSNDSDLALPVREVRERLPVGTVSPHPGPVHGSQRPLHSPRKRALVPLADSRRTGLRRCPERRRS